MATGGGDFEGAPRGTLAFNVGKIRGMAGLDRAFRRGDRGGQDLAALEMVDQRQQMRRGQNAGAVDPCGLAAAFGRADHGQAGIMGVHGGGQHAADLADLAVQAELPHRQRIGQRVYRNRLHRTQHRQRNRQIEMAPFFQDIGRGQIDGQALWRQGQADRLQCPAHPLPSLADSLVRQANNCKPGQAGRKLGLHLDRLRPQAGKGDGVDCGDHIFFYKSGLSSFSSIISGPHISLIITNGTFSLNKQCKSNNNPAIPLMNLFAIDWNSLLLIPYTDTSG